MNDQSSREIKQFKLKHQSDRFTKKARENVTLASWDRLQGTCGGADEGVYRDDFQGSVRTVRQDNRKNKGVWTTGQKRVCLRPRTHKLDAHSYWNNGTRFTPTAITHVYGGGKTSLLCQ